MGAAQACSVQSQVESVDQCAGFGQGLYVAGIAVQGHDCLGAAGKLDLGHAVEGPAQAIPGIRRNGIIEHGRAVAAQLDAAAGAVRMKTVAQQRQHGVGMGQSGHVQSVLGAEPAQ
ncbi:hypothetical protein D3C76_1410250 [compost metagenome]